MCSPNLWTFQDRASHSLIFEWHSTQDNGNIYPMFTKNIFESIKNKSGISKKLEFINLLSHIVNFRDEHTDTRIMLLSILFNQFANNEPDDFFPNYRSWNTAYLIRNDLDDDDEFDFEPGTGVHNFFLNN